MKKLYNKPEMKKSMIALLLILISASCTPGADTGIAETYIHDIQGCNHTSPFAGKKVSNIRGVVTQKISNGFFMQSVEVDQMDCSSEGIFVFTRDYPSVMVGDLVMVDGKVEEYNSGKEEDHQLTQTEIIEPNFEVIQTGVDVSEPILLNDLMRLRPDTVIENDGMSDFDIQQDGLDFYESLESMLVEIDQAIVVGAKNSYNEIVVIPASEAQNNILSIQGALLETAVDRNPERLVIKLPENDERNINIGDRITTPIIGIMYYSYDNYKLLSLNPIEVTKANPTITPFEKHANGLSIATYNLENLSPFDHENRISAFANQIVAILSSPDILVLNEVMDDSGSVDDGEVTADRNLQRLLNAIIDQGGPVYEFSYIDPENNQDGGIAGGNIRCVLLYRIDQGIKLAEPVNQDEDLLVLHDRLLVRSNPMRIGIREAIFKNSRKPVLWLLEKENKQFLVIGIHSLSKGTNDPEWGNQQPPEQPSDTTRIGQAKMINAFVDEILSQNGSFPVFIAGDANDVPWSETMRSLTGPYLLNVSDFEDEEERYTYIFEGNAQLIDQILINKNLAVNIIQARYMHLNTWMNDMEKLSDHDPVIVEVELNQD